MEIIRKILTSLWRPFWSYLHLWYDHFTDRVDTTQLAKLTPSRPPTREFVLHWLCQTTSCSGMSRLSSLLVVAGDGCFLFAKSKVHCYNWPVCLLRCLIVRLPRFGNQLEICWWLVINTTNPSPGVSHGGQGGHTQADEELGPLIGVILPSSCQTRHQVSSRGEWFFFSEKSQNYITVACWSAHLCFVGSLFGQKLRYWWLNISMYNKHRLFPMCDSVQGEGSSGHHITKRTAKHYGGLGVGSSCTVKGSYCSCHYCRWGQRRDTTISTTYLIISTISTHGHFSVSRCDHGFIHCVKHGATAYHHGIGQFTARLLIKYIYGDVFR